MLSICIPVYNSDVRNLTAGLKKQADATGCPCEILLIDDASDSDYREVNSQLAAIDNVRYVELPANIGRSAIRNLLAREARYRYLVFMDCDAQLISISFLSNYLALCRPGVVCYGGKSNPASCPAPQARLRWTYSCQREELPAKLRNLHPNRSFISFNFLIDKNIFNTVEFDETLTAYGHEDTLFGLQLAEHGFTITHTDNPLLYRNSDSAAEFIRKTEQGIINLVAIEKRYPALTEDVKLLRAAKMARGLKLTAMLSAVFRLLKKPLLANLTGNRPSIALFDFYKLGFLCSLASRCPSKG
jgi:glycosyltransferase involved in cell wall biosynthesis